MSDRRSKNNKGALQKVGSFLGVTEDDSQMRVWKDKCTERAQSGEVGVSFRNIIPGADRGQKQLLNQLEHTLSEVSIACQQNQVLLDEFAQSAIPDTGINNQTGRDTLLFSELDSTMTPSSASQETSFQSSSRTISTRVKLAANTDKKQASSSHQNKKQASSSLQNKKQASSSLQTTKQASSSLQNKKQASSSLQTKKQASSSLQTTKQASSSQTTKQASSSQTTKQASSSQTTKQASSSQTTKQASSSQTTKQASSSQTTKPASSSHQNTRLQPPDTHHVGTRKGESSDVIEMMPRLHTLNRLDQSVDIDISSSSANTYTNKAGTHPTVSKILDDMVKENERCREAACYRLYYKKPPKLRESLLSAVEREGETEDESSPMGEVAITSRVYTQSEPCLQQNKDHSNLVVASLKRHSDWTGNPEVFEADLKATRRASITFSPLVKKFTFPLEPSFEGPDRSENLLKKLFRTKQPHLRQLQKEGLVELEGNQQREVEEAVVQREVSHPVYAAASISLSHVEGRPSKSILKNRMLDAGEFDLNPELEDYLNSDPKPPLVPTEGNTEYLYRAEALEHYRKFVAAEIAFKKEELLRKKLALEKMIIQKQKLIDDVLEMTDAHFYDPRGNSKKGWKQLMKENCRVLFLNESKDGRNRSIREQLYRLHEFMPVFTYFMCITQFVVTVILVTLGGVNPVGLEPQLVLRSNVPTFRGLETVEHWKVRNIWVGPPPMFFVKMGGLFAPCLRNDIFVNMLYALKGYGEDPVIGCCEMPNRHAAATTTEAECDQMTSGVGIWWKGELCSERRKQNVSWTFNHIMRPCCYSLKTQCRMMSHEHCTFLEGVFFFGDDPKTEHCSLVNCVSRLCSLTGRKHKTKMPYLTTGVGQWYRLITSVFAHQGIIHVLLVVLLQLLIGHQIEIIAGWLRIGIIYWVSAIMGLMVGATFNPYLPHLGAGAAVFGLVGVISVELVQSWQLIAHPWREVLKLVLICALFILSGTLPFVDNMELIAGYIFGALTGMIVLPYITFGKWHAMRKRVIVAFAVPVLMLCIFAVFFLFLHAQWISTQCRACRRINCVSYTKTMCKISELW